MTAFGKALLSYGFYDSYDLLVFVRVISAQHLLRLAAMCLARKGCAYSQRLFRFSRI